MFIKNSTESVDFFYFHILLGNMKEYVEFDLLTSFQLFRYSRTFLEESNGPN